MKIVQFVPGMAIALEGLERWMAPYETDRINARPFSSYSRRLLR
jgi:hypothetical protein